ncbi:MAG: hypothetical protein AAGE94_11375 [Acidobacteriota bacterium]
MIGVVGVASGQYISPGPTADGRLSITGIPAESELDRQIEDARWQLGPLHVDPWLGVKDVSVVSDQTDGGDDTDLTATVGAGLRAYAGNEVVWAAHVLPEYVWWEDADDKGGLAGRLGTGVFGYLNRVRFELSWRQVEAQQYFNAELPLLTLLETRTTRAAIEVEVVRGGFVFAYGEREDVAGDADDSLTFTTLDRSQERLVAGLGLRGRDGFEVGVAIEDRSVDFERTARSLSSDGDTVRLFVRLHRERIRAWLDIGRQETEPTVDSRLRPFEETVGDVAVDWRASRSVEVRAFGRRDVDYAVAADVSHIVSERFGFGVRLRPGRSVIGLLAATGDDVYEPLLGGRRIDDVEELQASFQMPVGDVLRLGLRWSRIDYDSNQPAFDRDVTAYGLSLELGPLLERWNVGSAGGTW